MKTNILWSDQVPERDGVKSPINDVAISRGDYKYDELIYQSN